MKDFYPIFLTSFVGDKQGLNYTEIALDALGLKSTAWSVFDILLSLLIRIIYRKTDTIP
jgi:hypothetical protein